MNEMETILPWMKELRRTLHRRPELAFCEEETAALIGDTLDTLGIPWQGGVAGTGVVATLKKGAGAVVALRADMDALPIEEATGLFFASEKKGCMHACGHDGHVAALLGAARLLTAKEFVGEVRLLFQPGEEDGNGAGEMVRAGAVDGVDAIFGGHLDTHWPTGMITVDEGPVCSFVDSFDIVLTGRGGHGARPHEARDCVVAGAAVIQALQTVVSRECDANTAAVVSIGEFHAGTVRNAIADKAILRGTIRTINADVRMRVLAAVERIISGSAATFGVEARIVWEDSIPAVINGAWGAGVARRAVTASGAEIGSQKLCSLGGEDFSFYFQVAKMKGCFVRFGARRGDNCGPAHSSTFDFDERALAYGARWLAEVAVAALAAC